MASSIEDILLAKALADAENRETNNNTSASIGALLGSGIGAMAPRMKDTTGLRDRELLNARGRNVGRRMAGSLVGAIMGGGLGAGVRQMAVQESPAAALLARIQTQGQLNPLDRAQLQSVLKDIYSNPGMV